MHAKTLGIGLVAGLAVSIGIGGEAAAQEPGSYAKRFSGNIGIAVISLPWYAGSNEYRVMTVPLIQVEFKDKLYLGGSTGGAGGGIGAHVVRRESFTWNVELAGTQTRRESHGSKLTGMGNRKGVSFAATSASYKLGFLTASSGLGFGLGEDAGVYGTADLTATKAFAGRWIGSVSTGATMADQANMKYEFGVNAAQAARRQVLIDTGDPRLSLEDAGTFTPKGGVKQTRVSASLGYRLAEKTTLLMFAQGTQLGREAAASPLTRERNAITTGLGVMYGF